MLSCTVLCVYPGYFGGALSQARARVFDRLPALHAVLSCLQPAMLTPSTDRTPRVRILLYSGSTLVGTSTCSKQQCVTGMSNGYQSTQTVPGNTRTTHASKITRDGNPRRFQDVIDLNLISRPNHKNGAFRKEKTKREIL